MTTMRGPRVAGRLATRPSVAVNGPIARRRPPQRAAPASVDDLVRQVRSRLARGYQGPCYSVRLADAKRDVWALLRELERVLSAA